jgi:hypothetical protein
MRIYNRVKRVGQVRDINDRDDLSLVDTSAAEELIKSFGSPKCLKGAGCFFVQVLDGDYGDIFFCESSIPWNDAWLYEFTQVIK